MEIKQCKFITSVANAEKCADHGVPEIAIAGKSTSANLPLSIT